MKISVVPKHLSNQGKVSTEVFVHTAKSTNSKILIESFTTSETPYSEEYGYNELSTIIDFDIFGKSTNWPISESFALLVDILDMRFLRSFIVEHAPNHRFLSKMMSFDSVGEYEMTNNRDKSVLYVADGVDLNNLIKLVSLCISVGVKHLTVIKSPVICENFKTWSNMFHQVLTFYNLSQSVNYVLHVQGYPEIERTNRDAELVTTVDLTLVIDFVEPSHTSDEEYDLILLNNCLPKENYDWNENKLKHLIELTDLYNI
ncbi:hypothetical protein WICPIJ_004169 [Wickerhamomyces pijperi]|uniref:Uncharacterized protein n=1 Tax=Wickerhamomyces pijperi TaxID=599730 RepID=A0A9P8Q6E5_WICPI|nr:hypothetical protein WICPIJ_004169 [Wickerhamomyces pijperi]